MSAVGKQLAVVSLGMSCQAAHQIHLHAEAVSQASGQALSVSRYPFDWLICPPVSIIAMLEADSFFPSSRSELILRARPCWPRYNVYFWHDFRPRRFSLARLLGRKIDIASTYRTMAQKYQYIAGKFRALRQIDRLVFVICNTQNNLTMVRKVSGTIRYVLAMEEVEALCDASDRYFGRPCEYLFVTYPDRVTGQSGREGLTVVNIRPDASEWEGDPAQWQEILASYFTGAGSRARCADPPPCQRIWSESAP